MVHMLKGTWLLIVLIWMINQLWNFTRIRGRRRIGRGEIVIILILTIGIGISNKKLHVKWKILEYIQIQLHMVIKMPSKVSSRCFFSYWFSFFFLFHSFSRVWYLLIIGMYSQEFTFCENVKSRLRNHTTKNKNKRNIMSLSIKLFFFFCIKS